MGVTPLTTALCLPAIEIGALLEGRMIVAMSNTFRNPPCFLLCPIHFSAATIKWEERYHQSFLNALRESQESLKADTFTAHAWAKFKACRIYSSPHDLEALSQLTIWSSNYLHDLTQARHKIFLLVLQVYRFSQPTELSNRRANEHNIGNYIKLSSARSHRESAAILSDEIFEQRQRQIFDLSPPLYPELEGLQGEIAADRELGLGAKLFNQDLKRLLGWSQSQETQPLDSDLIWIQQIAQTGNSSNGHEFEKLVRKSLLKLGFSNSCNNPRASLNPNATGGAGGIDVYCDAPYALVGECKASKHSRVPNSVTAQLIHLGITHLGQTQFAQSIKLIFAAGPLTTPADRAARENHMNVLRPETLQRLTELKVLHPGAIDLLKLKPCLQEAPFGEEADTKVNQFIDDTWQQLKLRSCLVQLVKTYLNNTGLGTVEIGTVFGAYAASANPELPKLKIEEIHEILIELSSPLAGYLGRSCVGKDSYSFYFLRDLNI
ncbi:MAG: DUF1802 family protein [Leptolyngbya sp. SIO1D8]|nr:DUF1802 family protein [Leptolyngbya sp. SIO1D8]